MLLSYIEFIDGDTTANKGVNNDKSIMEYTLDNRETVVIILQLFYYNSDELWSLQSLTPFDWYSDVM